MNEKNETYEYLYRIATTSLTVVLGLLFAKVTEVITTVSLFDTNAATGFLVVDSLIIILLMLMGVIGTIAYAHSERSIPFRPIYFIICLIFVALPLYLSAQYIGKVIVPTTPNVPLSGVVYKINIFKYGMIGIFVCFVSLIVYLLLLFLSDRAEHMARGQYKISRTQFFSITFFNASGALYALLSILFTDNLIRFCLSIVAIAGATAYLVVIWARQVDASYRQQTKKRIGYKPLPIVPTVETISD